MPFVLLIMGIALLVSSVRGTQDQLFTLVKGDFTGQNNYVYWLVSILVIGSVGYIQDLRKLSTAFLVLVVLVLFLTRGNTHAIGGGFFEQFTKQLASTQTPTPTGATQTASTLGTLPSLQLPTLPSIINF